MKSNKMLAVVSLALAIMVCFSAVAYAAAYSDRYGDSELKRSSTVKRVVKNVQADLPYNTSEPLSHDGIFGSKTEKAAKLFQKMYKLSVDGVVGKETKTKLYPERNKVFNY